MTAIDIDFDTAVTQLNALADNRPTFIYEAPDGVNCVYFADGTPSCIVGHVIANLGGSHDDLKLAWHTEDPDAGELDLNDESAVGDLVRHGVLNADEKTEDLLSRVQGKQDTGIPWGRAVAEAIEEVQVFTF